MKRYPQEYDADSDPNWGRGVSPELRVKWQAENDRANERRRKGWPGPLIFRARLRESAGLPMKFRPTE
jgi:hypothetical protein